jgi:aryl-alcohol dehydrogenase-like predicted oxidoreductase
MTPVGKLVTVIERFRFFIAPSYPTGLATRQRPQNIERVRKHNDIAQRCGQSLAQMALAWTLRDPRVTSVLIGASRADQVRENVGGGDRSLCDERWH